MSASNNKFELAVAVPIMNPYFRYKNRYSFTIDDRLSSDSMSIRLLKTDSDTSISNASEVLAVGDRITLKDDDGNVDDTTISGVTTSGLLLGVDDDMTAFDDNTDVASSGVGYGNAVPGGWYLDGFAPQTIAMTVGRDIGAFDNFCFKITLPQTDATEYNLYLIQSINTDYYVQNLKHRIGIKTRWTVATGTNYGSTSFLRITNQTTSRGFMLYSGSDTTISSWESQTSSDIYLTESSIDYYRIYVLLQSESQEISASSTLYVDEIYLEHVYNPVSGKTIYGESPSITSTENCYYEMDYYDQASLKIRKIQLQTDVTMLDKSITKFDATGWGERNVKYEITCRFTNVSTDMWDKMSEFLNIQSNGYKLNLHPYRDELPSILTGYVYIDGIDYSNWDMNMVSFDFKFREC